jgi:membrane protease YdiL (CAAX protease family)
MEHNKLVKYFSRLNFFIFIALSLLVVTILNFLILEILPENTLSIDALMQITKSWYGIILVIIIGPAFETILFQKILISAVKEMVSKEKSAFILSTLVSASVFGLAHGIYNMHYVFYAFVAGLVFAITYNLCDYRKESSSLATFIIHALWNLIALFVYFR